MDDLFSRRTLIRTTALLAAARQLGCTARTPQALETSEAPENATPAKPAPRAQSNGSSLGYDALGCPEKPVAYVLGLDSLERSDPMGAALEAAGFAVEPLPLDRSPTELRGLIALPSWSSAEAEYQAYVEEFAADLYTFVDSANVLVQLAQAPDVEQVPPFLPTTHAAKRGTKTVGSVKVASPASPLLASIKTHDEAIAWPISDEPVTVFRDQDGFEVFLSDKSGRNALLMEGAYGQGRIVLSALALDDPPDDVAAQIADQVLRNLFDHVRAVCVREAPALSPTTHGADNAFTPGSSLLAVLPDTQVYSLRLPGLFDAHTSWIRRHAEALDIRYAVHLGDIVNNNSRREWERASAAMAILHDVVPYALAPGNHDYGPSGDGSTRDTLLNEYFSFAQYSAMPTFGGAYEAGRLDSSYHLFSIQDRDFILLALEWGPRDEVVAWADEVMRAHPDRDGILATHAYLNNNDRRYDHRDTKHSQRFNPHDYATPGGVNDGEELWQKLVRHHRFVMTLNGHVLGDGNGYLASVTDRGNTCHQMLANYQMRTLGGESYMRLLEFLPDGRTVRVFTYSPLYDKFLDDHDQNFTIVLD